MIILLLNLFSGIPLLIGKRNLITTLVNFPQLFIITSFAVILSFFSPEYIGFYILSVLLILLFLLFKEKLILFSIVVLLLVLVGEINPTLRLVIQLIAIIFLVSIVLKNYGFESENYPPIPSIVLSFILFLYIALTISILNSDYSFAAVPLVLRLSAFFVFVYLFFVMIKDVKIAKLYINAIIVSAIIIAVGTLYDFIVSGFNILMITGEIYRTGGFISNYNATGGYFAISIPLLIASLYKPQSQKQKLLTYTIIGTLIIALIITGSRSAFLACTVSVFLILYILNKKLLVRITILFISLILLLLLIDTTREFLTLLFRVERGLTHREYLWNISINLIKDNFLFGIGPGAYAYKMFDYFPTMLDSYEGQVLSGLFQMTAGRNNAHNFYLIMFADLGLMGFLASIMIPYVFFRIVKMIFQSIKKSCNNSYYLIVGVFASMTGLLVRALFDGINVLSYGWISVDLPFWLMFSILIYFYNSIVYQEKQFSKNR